jgi:hypothetical protein
LCETCNKVVKKADTTVTIDAMVNAQLSPKDLVYMVVAEDMCSTLNAFKTDMNSSLARQVRLIVQQISSEVEGKHVDEFTPAPSTQHPARPLPLT